MPKILESSLILMMEWKMGLLEIRRKIGGGSIDGNGEETAKQSPVKTTRSTPNPKDIPSPKLGIDLQSGRAQMRQLAENKSGMQTKSSVASDENQRNTPKVAPSKPHQLPPIDLTGRLEATHQEGVETDQAEHEDAGWMIDELARRTDAF